MKSVARAMAQILIIFIGVMMIDTPFPNVYVDIAFSIAGALFLLVIFPMLGKRNADPA